MAKRRTKPKEDVAEVYGVNPETVARWARAGCPYDRKGGKQRYLFNVQEVGEWLQQQGRTGLPGRPVPEGDSADLRRARLQLTIEKALLTRIKRQEAEHKVHDVGECQRRQVQKILATKKAFLALPRSVSAELKGKSRNEIERILTGRLEEIMRSFAGERGHAK